jgi:hypothetical protein
MKWSRRRKLATPEDMSDVCLESGSGVAEGLSLEGGALWAGQGHYEFRLPWNIFKLKFCLKRKFWYQQRRLTGLCLFKRNAGVANCLRCFQKLNLRSASGLLWFSFSTHTHTHLPQKFRCGKRETLCVIIRHYTPDGHTGCVADRRLQLKAGQGPVADSCQHGNEHHQSTV